MGRAKLFPQKLIGYVDSLAVKTVYSWLLYQTLDRFGMAAGEATQVAQKGYQLPTRTLVKYSEEQIVISALAGTAIHGKHPTQEPPRQEVSHPGATTTWKCSASRPQGSAKRTSGPTHRGALWQDTYLCLS